MFGVVDKAVRQLLDGDAVGPPVELGSGAG